MLVILLILIILLIYFEPTLDKTENGDVLLWYTSNRNSKVVERKYIYLFTLSKF